VARPFSSPAILAFAMPSRPLQSLLAASRASLLAALTVTAGLLACGASRSTATHPIGAAGEAAASAASARGGVLVRVNQVGFPSGAIKSATVLAQAPLRSRAFRVVNAGGATVLAGRASGDRGSWNARWRHSYPLDFTTLHVPGSYRIVLPAYGQARSPAFTVGEGAYSRLAADEVSFLRAQRDGPEVDSSLLGRRPSHLADSQAIVYATPRFRNGVLVGGLTALPGPPINVSGGWADAGDYMKFVETASFAETMLLYTIRQYPAALGSVEPQLLAEARYGLDWLGRMWDQSTGVLSYQVGIGNGNARVEGDHDVNWRLPQHDETLHVSAGRGAYYVRYRPVFQDGTGGRPISPNLAGRMAAAFGLCAQVFQRTDPAYAHQCLLWGQTIFDRADPHPRALVTASPFAFYPQQEWEGDMELGAAELLRATATTTQRSGLPHPDPPYWFEQADNWAQSYMEGGLDGTDTLNLYDQAALAHMELMEDRAFVSPREVAEMQSDQNNVLRDLGDQLSAAARLAAHDPFGIGYRYENDDVVSHLLGLSLEARFYDQIAGTHTYERFAQRQLDAVLGANAWGVAFVVGAGSQFPRCLHHQVANLSGSLDGRSPLLLGAVVPGPVSVRDMRGLGAAEGHRRCPARGGNPYGQFTGRGAAYEDSVRNPATNEPSDDIAALALLAFAREAGG
jgi:endoglucanase